ncbi:TerD family protein [Dactylosporangium sp. NPDC051484]|uniref:TerD family protein n=1 Tax=Dactylosporangium sp. NPDC051484 TaxID=3154942 RepID=UPI00344DF01E
MTLVLVKGQNAPLVASWLKVTVDAAVAVDLSAVLLAETGRVRSDGDFVFYNQPKGAGLSWRPFDGGGAQRVEVDLSALPADVVRILAVVSRDGPTATFGGVPAPVARATDATGAELATFSIDGLSAERAVIAWELYRRGGGWKIRAVGQGYSGGLAELAVVHGVDVEQDEPPPASAESYRPAPAVPAPPVGGVPQERLCEQVRGVFEDAARSAYALRSAIGYAAQRRDDEISELLADPRFRNSPETASARAEADRRHDELVSRAESDHRRDVAQLVSELRGLAVTLPAPMAGWDSPAWRGRLPPPTTAAAIRVGELHVPEAPQLRIPLLFRLPLTRALWIDSANVDRPAAVSMARSIVVRLLAAHPAGWLGVSVADLAGGGTAALALDPTGAPGSGRLSPPVATTPQQLNALLDNLVDRVDLVQMAMRAGTVGTLPGTIDGGRRLLVLHDFPYGFDERSVAQLQYLLSEGPAAGVHLLMVADPADSSTLGPLISAMWRSMSRLPVVSDDHMGDPWVGLTWTFTPDAPAGSTAVDEILARLARGADGR